MKVKRHFTSPALSRRPVLRVALRIALCAILCALAVFAAPFASAQNNIITGISPTVVAAGASAVPPTLTITGSLGILSQSSSIGVCIEDGSEDIQLFYSQAQFTFTATTITLNPVGLPVTTPDQFGVALTSECGNATSNYAPFQVVAPQEGRVSPYIIAPNSAATTVDVYGSYFQNIATIYLLNSSGTYTALTTTFVSSTHLQVLIPAANLTAVARLNLVVDNSAVPAGTFGSILSTPFSVQVGSLAPTTTTVSSTPTPLTLVADVTSTLPGVPTGTVTFNGTGLSTPPTGTLALLPSTRAIGSAINTNNSIGDQQGFFSADLNGDGISDVVTLDTYDNSVHVSLATGNGQYPFQSAAYLNNDGGQQVESIALGDFNGDGYTDIAIGYVAGYYGLTNTVVLLLNNGDGTFTPAATVASPNADPGYLSQVFAGDVNGDGRTDLIVRDSSNTITTLINQGNGLGYPTFLQTDSFVLAYIPYTPLLLQDVTGDGLPDLVYATNYNCGEFCDPNALVVIADPASPNSGKYSTATSVLTSIDTTDVPGNFAPTGIVIGDLGNGKQDVAISEVGTGTPPADVAVLLNNGTGTFTLEGDYVTPDNPVGLAIGDINGDGIPDIVTLETEDSNVVVLYGSATSPYSTHSTYPQSNQLQGGNPVIGDFNHDGYTDIVVASQTGTDVPTNYISVLPTTGTAQASTPVTLAAGDYSIIGNYSGDNTYAASASNIFDQFVDGTITSYTPTSVVAGGSGFTLTLNGTFGNLNPSNNVAVCYSGGPIAAGTYGPTQIQVTVPASAYTAPGTLNFYLGNATAGFFPACFAHDSNTVAVTIAAGIGQLTFTPDHLDFGNQLINTESASQTVTVKNIGTAAVNFTADFNPPAYPITGQGCLLGGPLAPGSSCTIQIAFFPSVTGSQPGNLTFQDDASGSPQAVPLTGTGVGTAQTITFGALSNQTYGVPPITLTATASSGLPVSYTVTGPATVSGSTLTITGAGTVSVTATQAGNSTYAAATPVTQSFTVAKAALTVTANNLSRQFGAANPTLTYSITGFVNGDTSAVVGGSATLTTTATSTSPAGTYPITFVTEALTAANYTFTYVAGTLTVTGGASQTITFGALSNQTYGAPPITLTATASSGLPVSYTVTGPATVSGSTLTITGAGTVSVTASQAGNGNYAAATPVTQSFTVAKASLTVTANNLTKVQGSPNPTLTYAITGFVNSDNAANSTTGAPSLSTTATTNSAPGTYPITISQGTLAAANYSFVFVPGTLTVSVNGAVVTVTPTTAGFGNQIVGIPSAPMTETLTYNGGGTLTINQIAITGSNAGDFTDTSSCGPTLTFGQSCTIAVTFTPTLVGARSATLSVTESATGTPLTVALTGNGLPFSFTSMTPNSGNLGDSATKITLTGAGFTAADTVLVNNTAVATTFISNNTLTATIPASFFATSGILQIAVTNAAFQVTTGSLPYTVNVPPVSIVFTGPPNPVSGQQAAIDFQLVNPYPVPLTATLTLTFTPEPSIGVDDPAVQFASGGRTYSFTIAAMSTQTPDIGLQTGTIAGTITVTLQLFAAGINVTPADVAPIVLTLPATAPTITAANLAISGTTLTVTVQGFSNTRELSQAVFNFTPATGKSLATHSLTVPVTPLFTTWFAGTGSDQYGSAFTYTQEFTVVGDVSDIQSVTVTLTNSIGNSNLGSATP